MEMWQISLSMSRARGQNRVSNKTISEICRAKVLRNSQQKRQLSNVEQNTMGIPEYLIFIFIFPKKLEVFFQWN